MKTTRRTETVRSTDQAPLLDPLTKKGLIGAGILAIIALVIVGIVLQKKMAEKAAQKDYERRAAAFMDKVRAFNLTSEVDCAMIEQTANENEDLWQGTDRQTEVLDKVAKAQAFVRANQEKQTLITTLAAMEAELSGGKVTAARCAEIRRSASSMLSTAADYGADVEARVKAVRTSASRFLANVLVEEAKAFYQAHPDDLRQSLTKLASAEDQIKTVLDDARRAKDKDVEDAMESQFQELVAIQDGICATLFTEQKIAAEPWRKLLLPAEKSHWHGAQVKGFKWTVDGGTMKLKGPDPDVNAQGVLSIGDEEKWRDFVLDISFKIKKGGFTLYTRLGQDAGPGVQNIEFYTEEGGSGNLQADTNYHFSISVIGSTFAAAELDGGALKVDQNIAWTKPRKGAVGFAIPREAEIEITEMRIKVLR